MINKLEALKKEITATEESRKQFIAKFENQLQAVNSEIEECEASIQQAVSNDDFEQFEAETDRLAFLKKKKAHYEAGLNNAETASIGDYDKIQMEIRDAVTEAAKAKTKELFQHCEAMEAIADEISALRKEAETILFSIKEWTDQPQRSLGLDYSAGLLRWARAASYDGMYQQTLKEHPEWSKMK